MKESKTPASPKTLETVRNLIQDWRRDKKGRRSMPEELWQAAAGLTGQYSLNRISKELRLNYTALKNRVNQHQRNNLPANVQEAEFVDLGVSRQVMICSCEVEMQSKSGANLKIRYTPDAGIDLDQLWRETLSRS